VKRILCGLIAGAMLVGLLLGCGGKGSAGSSSGERKKVTFWYDNSGKEAEVYEVAIKAYNESQKRFQVEGLSMNDAQKLIVAMSSNEAPDVIKVSNQSIVQYQKNGLIQNLQTYIESEKFDLGKYSQQAIAANTVDGVVCALPLSAYTIQMFYNKDLLKAAGYNEPPATVEEMYEMAVAATVVDGSGKITTLGYPLFPLASARQELIYAFGGRWWDGNSKPTPDNPAILDSLTMNVKYRQKYGVDAVNAFVASANTNRYTEQDMFFAGKQLFRLDGSWLPTMMKKFNSTVNYGITLIPGTNANPALRGTSRFETDSIGVPQMANNKDGAWDFAKWLCSEKGAKIINLGTGTLPSVKALYDDPELLAGPGFAEFVAALKEEKGIQYPQMHDSQEYISLINSALDDVYAGKKTPKAAMENLKVLASVLK
jgi:multiple sugar transport system substrate-binding protein